MTPYIELADAQEYFDERLYSDAWNDASDADKLKALKMATRRIDKLSYIKNKYDESQDNQFPRGTDIDVPDDIKQACCELALALLNGLDINSEIDNLAVEGQGFANVKDTYNRTFVMDHIRAGIPSIEAWELLVPYLNDPRQVIIKRI